MARTSNPAQPAFTEIKRFDSEAEIDRAIEKLKRRHSELQALWDDQVRYDDQRRRNLEENIRNTVLEIFGPNSPEYGQHRNHRIWHGPMWTGMSPSQIQAGFRDGFAHTTVMLKGLIDRLEEKRGELAQDRDASARSAFEDMALHSRIATVADDLYRDRHYSQAVLEASKALINYVKEKSRRDDLDGSGLMSTVFSVKKPVLSFNDLKDRTDEDEQEGLMHLFMGAALALRNPRAHARYDDPPELALDYIAFLSMLAKRLDTARRR